jgi:hypothetical protein
MKQRCYSPKDKKYKYYGAKGITVCDEWLNDCQTFFEWALSNGYNDNLTIDRIDNDKGYCPDNCQWIIFAKNIQRSHEKRTYQKREPKVKTIKQSYHYVEINGEIKCKKEWAAFAGINYRTIIKRYRLGLRGEDLIRPTTQAINKMLKAES